MTKVIRHPVKSTLCKFRNKKYINFSCAKFVVAPKPMHFVALFNLVLFLGNL